MADVFISYARSTEGQAQQIAKALRELGYNVWRDDDLPAHRDYTTVIEEHLHAAKAVVVAWSAEAVKSRWVCAEADVAHEAGVLVQLTLDGSTPPLPFNRIQCADMNGWNGEPEAPGWRKVVASVVDLVGQDLAAETAAPEPANGGAARPLSGAAARWVSIESSLDPDDYADFLHVFPQSEQAFEARRQKRRVEAWRGVDQTNLTAVNAFVRAGSFPALKAHAQAVADELKAAEDRAAAAAAPAPAPPSAPVVEAVPAAAAVAAVAAEAELHRDPEPVLHEPEPEPAPQAVAAPEPEPVAEAAPEPEPEAAEPEPHATLEPEPSPEPVVEAAAQPQPEPEPEPAVAEAAAPVVEAAPASEPAPARLPEPAPVTERYTPTPAAAAARKGGLPLIPIIAGVVVLGGLAVGAVVLMQPHKPATAGPAGPAPAPASGPVAQTPPPAGPAPAAIPPLDQDATALVADAQHFGRPAQELGALNGASTRITELVAQVKGLPPTAAAGDRDTLVGQLNTIASGMAGTEAATLDRIAHAQLADATRNLGPASGPGAQALDTLRKASALLDAAAGAVAHAPAPEAAMQAEHQVFVAYAGFAAADAAMPRFYAPMKREAFDRISAQAHALAAQVTTLAASPKPWFLASSSRKTAYQQLQTNLATAKAKLAELDGMSGSVAQQTDPVQLEHLIGQATAIRETLAGLVSSSQAAAQASAGGNSPSH
ncbi:MAG TPA: toll/interleukin-1 receptor domain-containing protein [Caulobacteraceae bacterium]|nr:toll/interleukin-1 receptor domain-containing protein [Caulobacteraceae bacterium]